MKECCSFLMFLFLFFLSKNSFSQVKIGDSPTQANANAVLELEANNKGFLLPRLNLTSTTSCAPLLAHIQGMVVQNIANINDVKPGLYINNGIKWVGVNDAISAVDSLKKEISSLNSQLPIKRAIIIAGQSNTLYGNGNVTNLPEFFGKNLSQLGRGNENLQEIPLTFYNTHMHIRYPNSGSFGSIFMNHYYDSLKLLYPNRPIQLLLIPCGAGASGFNPTTYDSSLHWRADGIYFQDLVNRIKWAKNKGYQIDAILWHQGETDAISNTINYKHILKNFISSLRDFVGNSKMPFILGEMVREYQQSRPNFQAIQTIINEISAEVPYTNTVSSFLLGFNDYDTIHFNAESHLALGYRYYNGFINAKLNATPPNFTSPTPGSYLVLNHNADSGFFSNIFKAYSNGNSPNQGLYSRLGDIWKYKNADGYYHFRLENINASGGTIGFFEWKQKINPFGLSENNKEDRASCIILNNTIGLDIFATNGQGFSSLVWETPGVYYNYYSLLHADIRESSGYWYFPMGQIYNFNNSIPLVQGQPLAKHVKLFCIKD
jgi:hypothetical protein